MNPSGSTLADLLARLDRRAERLDEIGEALEELRAEGPAPCCGRGCAGCVRYATVLPTLPRGALANLEP